MNEKERNSTILRYSERLVKYGYDPKTLGWSKNKENIRFKVLSEIGDLNNCSILDVGCGFGDFFKYLKLYNINVDYAGIDINPNLIAIAKKAHPDAKFYVMDFEDSQIEQTFDWVFSSGIFNYRLSDNIQFIKNMLRKMHKYSYKGFAADFLSSYVDYRDPDLHYTQPEKIFSFCKTLSRRVVLRSDYMPFEFSVYCYKKDGFNKRTVFSEYDLEINK